MAVAEVTVKFEKITPIGMVNVTAVAPVKFVPVIVTMVPTGPFVGVKLVSVGGLNALVTVKAPGALLAVPPGVVTLSGPVVAPLGTVAEIEVAEVTVKLTALVPLKVTAVAPVKAVPVIVTLLPTGPFVGLKLAIVGEGAALNTVTMTGAEVEVVGLPSPRTMAVKVWGGGLLLAVVVSHEIEYGAVVTGWPRGTPSSWNWTLETCAVSETVALTVIVPSTATGGDREGGEAMVTFGALDTVTVSGAEGVVLPASSRGTAMRV